MKKFFCSFLMTFSLLLMIFLGSCNQVHAEGKDKDLSKKDLPESWRWGSLISQPLPWSKDARFQEVIKKNQTMILMAKFKATLKDPMPGELFNVGHAADTLAGTVIPDGQMFSQNSTLGPYTTGKGYRSGPMYKGTSVVTSVGGGVCKIATFLYNLAILSNLPVVERHNHGMTVPYVPPGQDATVYFGVKDVRFINNTGGPIVIWADTVGKTLYMAFYGQKIPPRVTWHHKTLKRINYWTVYKRNDQLPKGSKKVLIPGQEGLIVQSWLTIKYDDGRVQTKKMGRCYYDPMPEVIEKGV